LAPEEKFPFAGNKTARKTYFFHGRKGPWRIAMLKKTLAIALICVAAPTFADPVGMGKTAKGDTLVDPKGMTLYTFDKDTDGKSNCTGVCATNWLPLTAGADAKPTGSWTVIDRGDASKNKQWAYKGKPLYTWSKDTVPGDIGGDGFNGAWRVAQP